MQCISLTFCSIGNAASAQFFLKSNYFADSKVQKIGFAFQTSSQHSISETLSYRWLQEKTAFKSFFILK